MIAKIARTKQPSASRVFKLKSVKESSDKGSWYTMDISLERGVEGESLKIARYWYDYVRNTAVNNVTVASGDTIVSSETNNTEMGTDEYFNF